MLGEAKTKQKSCRGGDSYIVIANNYTQTDMLERQIGQHVGWTERRYPDRQTCY